MDETSALNILGLGPDATGEMAKKRFRTLAKSNHPDRYAADECGAEAAEARMKEINAAFHFLAPLLPSGSVQEKEAKKRSETGPGKHTGNPTPERPGFFSSMRKRWQQKRHRGAVRPKSPLKKEARSARPRVNRPAKSPAFDSLLASMALNRRPSPGARGKKPAGKKMANRPYDNYCRYMDVKKRLQRSRQRSSQTGIGRVEKIRPVERVKPVGNP